MNKRILWSRILCVVGLAMIVVGAVSVFRAVLLPALLVLPVIGSWLATLGAFLGRSRYRRFMCCAFVLTLYGTIVGFLLIRIFEDPTVPWWAFVAVAYPVGAILSLVGAGLVLVESFRKPLVPKDNVEAT